MKEDRISRREERRYRRELRRANKRMRQLRKQNMSDYSTTDPLEEALPNRLKPYKNWIWLYFLDHF